MDASQKEKEPSKLTKWFKRLGVAGFLFFFVKGLIWLAIIFWGGKCAMESGM